MKRRNVANNPGRILQKRILKNMSGRKEVVMLLTINLLKTLKERLKILLII